jgi:ATP-dependent DNA helicase MPH1
MCYDTLQALANGTTDADGKKIKKAKLVNEPLFRALIQDMERLRIAAAAEAGAGRMVHPKIDKLTSLLVQHFSSEIDDGGSGGDVREKDLAKGSKVMVFASYRQAVEQIVEELNRQDPLIRAHRFIGQAASKEGIKGLKQKEQLEVTGCSWTPYRGTS